MRRAAAAVAAVGLLAGCARSAAGSASGPDYRRDTAANVRAQLAADQLVPKIQDDPTYAGSAIVRDGIAVFVVDGGSVALRSLVAAERAVPAHLARAAHNHSLATLATVTERIDADATRLIRQGIRLSSWGPDVRDNLVRITLEKFSPSQATLLVARYGGPDLVEVSPDSEHVTGSGAVAP